MTDPDAPWVPREAYRHLAALAAEMRPDWSRQDLWDAILAARSAGMPWKETFREVCRLVWAQDETPATLRNSARRPAPAANDPEAYAHGGALWRAALEEVQARKTGPQQRLTEHNDRRQAG